MSSYYLQCPGAQVTRAERELIKTCAVAYSAMSRPTFVNIGVMWGCTVHCLRAGHPTARIMALDIKYTWKIEHKAFLNVEWITGNSTTYHEQFKAPIDLLLIDGNHRYSAISKDIAGWTPKVRVGGMVICHDYKPASYNLIHFPQLADVRRAVNEWVQSGQEWKIVNRADSVVVCKRIKNSLGG